MKYAFKPAEKAFPGSMVLRTIDVEMDADSFESAMVSIDGKFLPAKVIAHAVAFAIKQRLANSIVNASTAKNDAGQLLSQKKREDLWQGLFDKALKKMKDGESPDWEAVFSEARGEAALDPRTREINAIVRARVAAWAKAKGRKLPKVDTDEYKAIFAKMLESKRAAIEAEADRRLAEIADIGDIDFDESDMIAESEESAETK